VQADPCDGRPDNFEDPQLAKLKLTYFDFDGGRGEPARLALHIGGIAFEDHRIAGKDWPAVRDKAPFLALPTLKVDGRVVSQSNSINRYVVKPTGLYRRDDLHAFPCDEVMEAVEDLALASRRPSAWPGTPRRRRARSLRRAASGVTWSSSRQGWKPPAASISLTGASRWRI